MKFEAFTYNYRLRTPQSNVEVVVLYRYVYPNEDVPDSETQLRLDPKLPEDINALLKERPEAYAVIELSGGILLEKTRFAGADGFFFQKFNVVRQDNTGMVANEEHVSVWTCDLCNELVHSRLLKGTYQFYFKRHSPIPVLAGSLPSASLGGGGGSAIVQPMANSVGAEAGDGGEEGLLVSGEEKKDV